MVRALLLVPVVVAACAQAGSGEDPPAEEDAAAAVADVVHDEGPVVDEEDIAVEDTGPAEPPPPPNNPPVAVADSIAILGSAPTNITVLYNDSDPDGDMLRVVEVTQGAHGLVEIVYGGTQVRYTPTDLTSVDQFEYTVDDARSGQATAVVTVELQSVPVLMITAPADGAVTAGAKVVVSFEVSGCQFTAPANAAEGCHAHKYLDGVAWVAPGDQGPGQYVQQDFVLGPMTSGKHTFVLQLIKNDGTDDPWVPAVQDTVTLEVP